MTEPRFVLLGTNPPHRVRLGRLAYTRAEAERRAEVLRLDGWTGVEVVSERSWAIEQAGLLLLGAQRCVDEAQLGLHWAREQLAEAERMS